MPTYCNNQMTDDKAAEIIKSIFPRWPKPRNSTVKWTSVHTICDALLHARIKCGHEGLDHCIKWAYDYLSK